MIGHQIPGHAGWWVKALLKDDSAETKEEIDEKPRRYLAIMHKGLFHYCVIIILCLRFTRIIREYSYLYRLPDLVCRVGWRGPICARSIVNVERVCLAGKATVVEVVVITFLAKCLLDDSTGKFSQFAQVIINSNAGTLYCDGSSHNI